MKGPLPAVLLAFLFLVMLGEIFYVEPPREVETRPVVVMPKINENGYFRLDPINDQSQVLISKTKADHLRAKKALEENDQDVLLELEDQNRIKLLKPIVYARFAIWVDDLIRTTIANEGQTFTGLVDFKCLNEIDKFPDELLTNTPEKKKIRELNSGVDVRLLTGEPCYVTKTKDELEAVYVGKEAGNLKKIRELRSNKRLMQVVANPTYAKSIRVEGDLVEIELEGSTWWVKIDRVSLGKW
jgi:hypothetical protein